MCRQPFARLFTHHKQQMATKERKRRTEVRQNSLSKQRNVRFRWTME
jgi:hypothetical protein